MKSAKDPRHLGRIKTIKDLFAYGFHEQEISVRAEDIISNTKDIDERISKAAPQWPIEKINRIDLAILRLAVYELINTDIPRKVAIDEAVELAKEFGGENSPSFVNGVLGAILDEIEKNEEKNNNGENGTKN